MVGIGESGLDFYYEHSPRERQTGAFLAHAEAARISRLPLIVHTRDADPETADLLAAEARKGGLTGVIHCFSTGRELAEKAIEIGFMISISGIVTFKNAEPLRQIVRNLPLDRILVETDSPYLAPVPKRGKQNEPSFLVHTAAEVARLKGVSSEELARATTSNFFRLFAKARPPAAAPA
ncbi:MAG TPA: TatD family hydrolase [Stellaceae bacterium]|nr:TatD family hydrolase [Stellaceae bacterium]